MIGWNSHIPSRQLLVFHLLSYTSSTDQTVILASLAGKFTVTLELVLVVESNREYMRNVPWSSSCDIVHKPSIHACVDHPCQLYV